MIVERARSYYIICVTLCHAMTELRLGRCHCDTFAVIHPFCVVSGFLNVPSKMKFNEGCYPFFEPISYVNRDNHDALCACPTPQYRQTERTQGLIDLKPPHCCNLSLTFGASSTWGPVMHIQKRKQACNRLDSNPQRKFCGHYRGP